MLVIQKCFLEELPLKPLLSWSHCEDLCSPKVRVLRLAGSGPEYEADEQCWQMLLGEGSTSE